MDIKSRIKERLVEMNADDLNHSEKKILNSAKPKWKMSYHGQHIPLKAKTKEGAKKESIEYASKNGFKPHHASLIKYWEVPTITGTSKVEEESPLPFMP